MSIETDIVNFMKYFSKYEENALSEDKEILKKIEKIDRILPYKNNIAALILKLDILLSEGYFVSEFLELDLSSIITLVNHRFKIPYSIYSRKEFIEKFTNMYDIGLLRKYLEKIRVNNSHVYEIISSAMLKRYDYVFNNIDESGIFSEFKELYDRIRNKDFPTFQYPKFIFSILNETDESVSKEKLKHGTSSYLLDCLIDKYFNDNTNNVLINLENIIYFNKSVNIIDKDRLSIYEKILRFDSLSIEEKKELYNTLTPMYKDFLYDDFKKCRDKRASLLNEAIIDLNKLGYYTKSGVKIYELKGQDFYIPIHVTGHKRKLCENPMHKAKKYETISISIISNKNLSTFCDVDEYISFGFNSLRQENIMHMFSDDSCSKGRENISSVNMLLTPEELIRNSVDNRGFNVYNEVLILEDSPIEVDYIVCYDQVTENDINLAQKMNIPIVVVYTSYYKEYRKSNGCATYPLKTKKYKY